MVPVNETINYLKDSFLEGLVKLFQHCLTTTYFKWKGDFYEETDGVAMRSPLTPVVANYFMENFEQQVLDQAPTKPKCWLRYVDDTFVIWPHGRDRLQEFLGHLNSINPQDTINDGNSNHHPRQNRGIIKTLVEKARRICDPEDIDKDLKHLEEAFVANGYSNQETKRVICPNRHRGCDSHEKNAEQLGFACLPYIHRSLGSVKDKNDPLATLGVYRIPCTCGQVYIGTTKRSISTGIGEHKRHCRLGHTEKSAVAEHAFKERNRGITGFCSKRPRY
ncbi:hypothetical protein NQ315_013931 [Exocentrus adspersus]|uniref:Reverse transcriptase domain-containing protein n=1 Tax=Exocentrus adspersus TaxID=1586481 RepID=A0AAV8VQX8_9CUCU|nr:hypothetical protein NQ315_013931 [Exocentrus adspersus]